MEDSTAVFPTSGGAPPSDVPAGIVKVLTLA
jgi:hypothetical protein